MKRSFAATPAIAQSTQLFPGVTFESDVQFTVRSPVAIRVVRGPRPVGLYRLRTVLSNESVLREETLSSMLVLVSSKGAYYHSAGSSPDGMSTGSSPFLVAEVIAWLQAEGKTTFNLGGATAAEEGLHRFKRGFGSVEVPLEAATCDLSPSVVRMLRRLLRR